MMSDSVLWCRVAIRRANSRERSSGRWTANVFTAGADGFGAGVRPAGPRVAAFPALRCSWRCLSRWPNSRRWRTLGTTSTRDRGAAARDPRRPARGLQFSDMMSPGPGQESAPSRTSRGFIHPAGARRDLCRFTKRCANRIRQGWPTRAAVSAPDRRTGNRLCTRGLAAVLSGPRRLA